MSITAGVLSQVSVSSTEAVLSATAATGGTGPYTYQWYRSTTSGFSPGAGNLISGATSLSLDDTGLIPNTLYYYKVVATDTGHSNDTAEYTQLAVTTSAPVQSQNQFAQSPYLGMIDLRFDYDTVSVVIDSSQVDPLYCGAAVKLVDSADGSPKVVGCDATDNDVFGFINFDIKTVQFLAGMSAEISQEGNVMYLYATAAISRGAQVVLDLSTNGGVRSVADGSSGDNIVGWAYDKATAAGQLIRVRLLTLSFQYKA